MAGDSSGWGPPDWIEVIAGAEVEPKILVYRRLRGGWGLEVRLPSLDSDIPGCVEYQRIEAGEIVWSALEAVIVAGAILALAESLGEAAGFAIAIIAAVLYLARLMRLLVGHLGGRGCERPRGRVALAARLALERARMIAESCNAVAGLANGCTGRVYMLGRIYEVRIDAAPEGGVRAVFQPLGKSGGYSSPGGSGTYPGQGGVR